MQHMDTIPLPPDGTAKQLSLLISHRLKEPGTLKITDVPSAVFDQWAQTHQDSRLRAQFRGSTLVLSMPSNLHDGAASSIGLHIRDTVLAMCPARDARVTCHGGLKTLPRNNVRKDGDMLVYSAQGGQETPLPGIAIEVGKSDDLSKANRDTTLWLDHSDCQVKIGIACKVQSNAQNRISKIVFNVYHFDFEAGTRTSPLGRVKKLSSLDLSNYQPNNPATIPPNSTISIPSYAVFSDNNYPASYPPHPAPPPPPIAPLNAVNAQDLTIWRAHQANEAARRQDIVVDFIAIADYIHLLGI